MAYMALGWIIAASQHEVCFFLTSTDRIIMDEIGTCQPLDSHRRPPFIGIRGHLLQVLTLTVGLNNQWPTRCRLLVEPACHMRWLFQHSWSICDCGHYYFTDEKTNLERELTCPYKQTWPDLLNTETIFFHHRIWDFPTWLLLARETRVKLMTQKILVKPSEDNGQLQIPLAPHVLHSWYIWNLFASLFSVVYDYINIYF